MKKIIIFIFALAAFILIPSLNKAHKSTDMLNNKTLGPEKAVESGYMTIVCYSDKSPQVSGKRQEVYNAMKLDGFIENIKKGKSEEVRIVIYIKSTKGTFVNSLYDMKYDGKKITNISYDVYSHAEEFIPLKPVVYSKLIKWDYKDEVWYGISYSKDNNGDFESFISFKKNSIVNKKQ